MNIHNEWRYTSIISLKNGRIIKGFLIYEHQVYDLINDVGRPKRWFRNKVFMIKNDQTVVAVPLKEISSLEFHKYTGNLSEDSTSFPVLLSSEESEQS